MQKAIVSMSDLHFLRIKVIHTILQNCEIPAWRSLVLRKKYKVRFSKDTSYALVKNMKIKQPLDCPWFILLFILVRLNDLPLQEINLYGAENHRQLMH